MSEIGSKEWLRTNALFGCQVDGCAETVSYHHDMLAVFNGKPICEQCYGEEAGEGDPDWGDLPAFEPFKCCG